MKYTRFPELVAESGLTHLLHVVQPEGLQLLPLPLFELLHLPVVIPLKFLPDLQEHVSKLHTAKHTHNKTLSRPSCTVRSGFLNMITVDIEIST